MLPSPQPKHRSIRSESIWARGRVLSIVLVTMGWSVALGEEPPRRLRTPSNAILVDKGNETGSEVAVTEDAVTEDAVTEDAVTEDASSGDSNLSREPTLPVRVSFRAQEPPARPTHHYVRLGTRDDSKASEYALDGVRGSESPKGMKHGRYCEPGMQRAGQPWCISPWAKCAVGSDYTVGYVGGGTPFAINSDRRTTQEGTFGMDYSGVFFTRNTWLRWSHGGRHQGGYGRYETEGPRILPEK